MHIQEIKEHFITYLDKCGYDLHPNGKYLIEGVLSKDVISDKKLHHEIYLMWEAHPKKTLGEIIHMTLHKTPAFQDNATDLVFAVKKDFEGYLQEQHNEYIELEPKQALELFDQHINIYVNTKKLQESLTT